MNGVYNEREDGLIDAQYNDLAEQAPEVIAELKAQREAFHRAQGWRPQHEIPELEPPPLGSVWKQRHDPRLGNVIITGFTRDLRWIKVKPVNYPESPERLFERTKLVKRVKSKPPVASNHPNAPAAGGGGGAAAAGGGGGNAQQGGRRRSKRHTKKAKKSRKAKKTRRA